MHLHFALIFLFLFLLFVLGDGFLRQFEATVYLTHELLAAVAEADVDVRGGS